MSEKEEIGSLYGKFKDAEALVAAYKSLEAEFTKRCQEMKGLERSLKAGETENRALQKKLDTVLDDDDFVEKAARDSRVAKQVLSRHLSNRLGLKAETPLLRGGFGFAASAPEKKPQTLEEAARLAEKLLK